MKRKTLAFLLADFFLALFLIVSIFPSFSKQDPIDPQSLTGEFEEGEKLAVFNNQEISTPQIAYGQIVTPLVLGQTNEQKDRNRSYQPKALRLRGNQPDFQFSYLFRQMGQDPDRRFPHLGQTAFHQDVRRLQGAGNLLLSSECSLHYVFLQRRSGSNALIRNSRDLLA